MDFLYIFDWIRMIRSKRSVGDPRKGSQRGSLKKSEKKKEPKGKKRRRGGGDGGNGESWYTYRLRGLETKEEKKRFAGESVPRSFKL